jgi:hypothetical protein
MTKSYLKFIKQKQDFSMYSSNNVQFQVYCQSFHTARSLRVTQLVSIFCMYKVLIGLFTTKPCDKVSGNTNIGFKRENNKTIDPSSWKIPLFLQLSWLTRCLSGWLPPMLLTQPGYRSQLPWEQMSEFPGTWHLPLTGWTSRT